MAQQPEQSVIRTSIAPFEQAAVDKMRPDLRQIMKSKFEPKAFEYTEIDIRSHCKTIIKEIMLDTQSNHLGNENMLNVLTASLYNEVYDCGKHFTLSEVRLALKEGFRGTFDTEKVQIVGLSAISFSKCLKSFKNWPMRLEAGKEYNKLIDAPKTTDRPMSDIYKMTNEKVITFYEEFKTEGKVGMLDWLVYDYLKEQGLINWTPKETAEMAKQAREQYKRDLELTAKKQKTNPQEIKKILEMPQKDNMSLIHLAKRIALKKFCDRLVKQNFEIKDLLK